MYSFEIGRAEPHQHLLEILMGLEHALRAPKMDPLQAMRETNETNGKGARPCNMGFFKSAIFTGSSNAQ